MNKSKFVVIVCVVLAIGAMLNVIPVHGQFPGSGQIPIDPKSIPKFVDPLPHFAYPGARVDADEYDKDDARDFVLWKGKKGDDKKAYSCNDLGHDLNAVRCKF